MVLPTDQTFKGVIAKDSHLIIQPGKLAAVKNAFKAIKT